MPKVNVSFKQTSRDMRLYAQTIAQEEKSEFVKKAIEYYLKHLDEKSE